MCLRVCWLCWFRQCVLGGTGSDGSQGKGRGWRIIDYRTSPLTAPPRQMELTTLFLCVRTHALPHALMTPAATTPVTTPVTTPAVTTPLPPHLSPHLPPPHHCRRTHRAGGSAEAMTARRKALVSNGPLAAAAVCLGLQRHLRVGSSALLGTLGAFVEEVQVRAGRLRARGVCGWVGGRRGDPLSLLLYAGSPTHNLSHANPLCNAHTCRTINTNPCP